MFGSTLRNGPLVGFAGPALILALGLIAYANSFDAPLVRDDILRIRNDPAIRGFPDCLLHTARPLANLTLHINYRLGKFQPQGYHAANLAIHLLAGLALYGLVRRTLLAVAPDRTAGSVVLPAFAAAALWTVHPVQTESVTYVIQRSEALASLFYLAGLYAFVRGRESPSRRAWLLATVLAAFLAVASKPVAVTFPVALLLFDRAYGSGSFARSWREHRWVLLGSAASWGLLAVLLMTTRESVATAGFGARLVSPWQYLLTQAGVILHYIRLAVWPSGLCFDYGWPPVESFSQALPAFAALGALVAVIAALYARFPRLGYPPLFFFLTLSVTSSIIPIAHCAMEHRIYLPLAGLIVSVVLAPGTLGRLRGAPSPRLASLAAGAALTFVLALFVILTLRRNEDYREPERLWRSALRFNPGNPVALVALAAQLNQQGRFDEAAACARRALDRLPRFSAMAKDEVVAATRARRGYEVVDALFQYSGAIESLAFVNLMRGRPDEAERLLREDLRLMPNSVSAHVNLAVIHGRKGRLAEALAEWQTVLRLQPDYPEAHRAIARIRPLLDRRP